MTPKHITLIIRDDRGAHYFVRPVEPPPRRVAVRPVMLLTARLAERCATCGEYPIHGACACTAEEEAL